MIRGYTITQTGAGHLEKGTCCQDFSAMKTLSLPDGTQALISAVADGVGSADFSDRGSRTACQTFIERCENGLNEMGERTGEALQALIRSAFEQADDAIDALAAQEENPYPLYATTLNGVIALEDGSVFFGHCGDGGLIALLGDGSYRCLTGRAKGESVNSVCPLSLREKWSFGQAAEVAALASMTDGVYDEAVTMDDRIFFPFFERAFLKPLTAEEDVLEEQQIYRDYLSCEEYVRRVRDDLTFALIQYPERVVQLPEIAFDEEAFEAECERQEKEREQLLAQCPTSEQSHAVKETPDPTAPDGRATDDPPTDQEIIPAEPAPIEPVAADQPAETGGAPEPSVPQASHETHPGDAQPKTAVKSKPAIPTRPISHAPLKGSSPTATAPRPTGTAAKAAPAPRPAGQANRQKAPVPAAPGGFLATLKNRICGEQKRRVMVQLSPDCCALMPQELACDRKGKPLGSVVQLISLKEYGAGGEPFCSAQSAAAVIAKGVRQLHDLQRSCGGLALNEVYLMKKGEAVQVFFHAVSAATSAERVADEEALAALMLALLRKGIASNPELPSRLRRQVAGYAPLARSCPPRLSDALNRLLDEAEVGHCPAAHSWEEGLLRSR